MRALPPRTHYFCMSSSNPYETPKHAGANHAGGEFPPGTPWYRMLNKHHWFVLTMATLAWVFDCLDQQLFILARKGAMEALGMDPNVYGPYATSIFMVGWATGGLIFGALGDRFGRAKMLTTTVLIYSLCTGLSALSQSYLEFCIYRFVTGLGVGGVFGLAVALVADTLPEQARSKALGTLQAMSALGNITAGACSLLMGNLARSGTINGADSWKYLFWIGALPAFLCVFIAIRMKEPEKWVKARAEGKLKGVQFGSYSAVFTNPKWRRHAFGGLILCLAGVIGVWGIGFFSPELVGGVIEASLKAEGLDPKEIGAQKANWMGYNSIVQNIGAFCGMIVFTKVAQNIGRKRTFVFASFAAMGATIFYFLCFNGKEDIWMSAIMGFFQLALFAGFAIYLPELFPIRLRSTGVSFCYNVGRFIAAAGPWTLGLLQGWLATRAAASVKEAAAQAGSVASDVAITAAKLDAFRHACCWLTSIYLIGLLALPFLPETKGQPLPED
jgi:MFS family permease